MNQYTRQAFRAVSLLVRTRTFNVIIFYLAGLFSFVIIHQRINEMLGYIALVAFTLLFIVFMWMGIERDIHYMSLAGRKKFDIENSTVISFYTVDDLMVNESK